MALPPNRSHISTEQQNALTNDLDLNATIDCVRLLATDHVKAITAVQEAASELSLFIDALYDKVSDGGRLIYIGCGTSGRLGVLDAAECPPTFQSKPNQIIGLIAGGDKSLRISSEAKEDDFEGITEDYQHINLCENDVVLGIAAGGTTPWVLGGIEQAKKQGAVTGFLTCSEVPQTADYHIYLDTGPEPLTGSTRMKGGTATKLALNIITTTLFIKLGKVYGNTMVDLKATNDKLKDRAIRIISSICNVNRTEASELLCCAGNDVKSAIVMYSLSVDIESAKEKLQASGGNLRAIL